MSLNLDDRPGSQYTIEASFGARFVTHLIDSFCITILMFVVFFVIGLIMNIVMIGAVGATQPSNSSEPSPLLMALFSILSLVSIGVPFGVFLLYYIVFEHYLQRTLGKFATGTIVVDERDGRATFGQIVGRSFCRLIPFEPLIAFFNGSFLHDTISGTKVIVKE